MGVAIIGVGVLHGVRVAINGREPFVDGVAGGYRCGPLLEEWDKAATTWEIVLAPIQKNQEVATTWEWSLTTAKASVA